MLDEKELNIKISKVYKILDNVMERFAKQALNDDLLNNVRKIIANQLKPLLVGEVSNLKIDVYIKDDRMRIKPLNLFTGLILSGYYVPAGELEDKTEWSTDKFTMKIIGNEVSIYPFNVDKTILEESK